VKAITGPACDRARAHISILIDGELSELGRSRLNRHLERCADCQAFHADATAAANALRTTPLEQLEHPLVLPRRPRPFAALRQLQLAAAVAAVGTVGLLSVYTSVNNIGLLQPSPSRAPVSSARLAFLDSVDWDMRFIEQVRKGAAVSGSAVPL